MANRSLLERVWAFNNQQPTRIWNVDRTNGETTFALQAQLRLGWTSKSRIIHHGRNALLERGPDSRLHEYCIEVFLIELHPVDIEIPKSWHDSQLVLVCQEDETMGYSYIRKTALAVQEETQPRHSIQPPQNMVIHADLSSKIEPVGLLKIL